MKAKASKRSRSKPLKMRHLKVWEWLGLHPDAQEHRSVPQRVLLEPVLEKLVADCDQADRIDLARTYIRWARQLRAAARLGGVGSIGGRLRMVLLDSDQGPRMRNLSPAEKIEMARICERWVIQLRASVALGDMDLPDIGAGRPWN